MENLEQQVEDIEPALPEMTFLSSLGQTYNENLISDYLACLLDPYRNGNGWEPLERVFRAVTCAEMPDTQHVTITREYGLQEDRRLDILLRMDDCILAIENKVQSHESFKQTELYCQDLHQLFRYAQVSYYFAFLTPSGDKAGCSAFQPLSYQKLIDKLKQVDVTQADMRSRMLYFDFIDHVEGYIVSEKKKQQEMSDIYLQHFETIDELEAKYTKHLGNILNRLEASLQTYWPNDKWRYNFSSGRHYQQIRYNKWPGNPDIHIEFHLHREWLKENKIPVFIDIEGQGAPAMRERCRSMLEKREDKLLTDCMKWRDLDRNLALLKKEYRLEKNIMIKEQEVAEEFAGIVWSDFKDVVSAVFETAMKEAPAESSPLRNN
ncbi:hypothetical protein GCM10008983_00070 [Lentibacillus halophilus]|uniref:PD-(D/E)XK nuclease superfamily protein n=1 Tax=Lentibacillus halophilus TaxID=295065 RepID=A0ABN0Z0Z7_9BACI